ncbi:MAG: serine/threonine-protein phosphatase, partial [Verrucomicrobia bacterium]|nr:serine/threonine-protein phosphatase [Cytophagales bacterium]
NTKIIIVADCTGHGVPAALMTVMGNSILNEIVSQRQIFEPDRILYELDSRITESFSNENESEQKINDGMDVSVIAFMDDKIYFAAAKNPLYLIKNNEHIQISGSKFPIGSTQYKKEKVFEKHTIEATKGDKFYLYSDGFQDQFGGETGRKYLSKRFKEYLHKINSLPMKVQLSHLQKEFEEWKGTENKQTDDILIIGIEL